MTLFIKEITSVKKVPLGTSYTVKFTNPSNQLNDVCHLSITVNKIKFEAAQAAHASVTSTTSCACAIIMIMAKEGGCYIEQLELCHENT